MSVADTTVLLPNVPAQPAKSAGCAEPFGVLDVVWGKQKHADEQPFAWHPLYFHMLDVAAVAQSLFDVHSTAQQRQDLEGLLGGPGLARKWVGLLAAAHDMGKAAPTFAFRVPVMAQHLDDVGLSERGKAPQSHEEVGAAVVTRQLKQIAGWSDKAARNFACCINLAHGTAPSGNAGAFHDPAWTDVQNALFRQVADTLGLDLTSPTLNLRSATDAHVLLISGLVKVSDWIGSSDTAFRYTDPRAFPDRKSYWRTAQHRAQRMIRTSRIRAMRLRPVAAPLSAESVLGVAKARPLQVAAFDLGQELFGEHFGAGLVIIEDVMGSGKTEASWALAHAGVRAGARGFYVALPTRATGDQAFRRIGAWLAAVAPGDQAMLTHSRWRYYQSGDSQAGTGTGGTDALAPDTRTDRTEPSMWFRGRHRALMASVGVGTVDQALMATLCSRYAPVRLYGLSGRVLVFDEVHAYDTYMTGLFCSLLRWSAYLGIPVIVLSATLPAHLRAEFVAAYQEGLDGEEHPPQVLDNGTYPRITSVNAGGVARQDHLARSLPNSTVRLQWLKHSARTPSDANALADYLYELTAPDRSGRIGIVLNTVAQAQQVADALRAVFAEEIAAGRVDVALLHAQYLPPHRSDVENAVQAAHNKDALGERTAALQITVGTQVIEQSLDLDFDYLISAFSLADLLLQRCGRLWRWQSSHAVPRPGWATNTLAVLLPDGAADDVPTFRTDSFVYSNSSPAALLRTWLTWKHLSVLHLPDELDRLVEAAYAPYADATCWAAAHNITLTPELHDAWAEAEQVQAAKAAEHSKQAQHAASVPPEEFEAQDLRAWRDTMTSLDALDTASDAGLALSTRLGINTTDLALLFDNQPFPGLTAEDSVLSVSTWIARDAQPLSALADQPLREALALHAGADGKYLSFHSDKVTGIWTSDCNTYQYAANTGLVKLPKEPRK